MNRKTFFWLYRQIRRRIPAIAALTFLNIWHSLMSVLFALGSRGVIDSAVAGDSRGFCRACLIQAGIIVCILLSQAGMRDLRERLFAAMEMDWKRRLLHGLLHGEYAAVSGYHSAELLNRMNNDVAKVDDGILSIIPGVAAMLTRLLAAVFVLGLLDARFALLIGVLGTVIIAVTTVMRRYLKELIRKVSEYDGKVYAHLQEAMEKLLMVQAMDVANEVEARADILLNQRHELHRKRKNASLVTNMGISAVSHGAGFAALVWCAAKLLRGQMSFGSMTAVMNLVNQLQIPVVNLSGVLPKYSQMTASAERLMELDGIQGEPIPMQEEAARVYQRMEAVCAEGLSFSYDREPVLEKAGFSLPKGSFTVVTGPSGIGKSTILKLLLGIFPPAAGQLYLDCGGERIALDRSTRRLFAYVPQGNLLLSGTLRDNLTIVNPHATVEELERALYVSTVEDFLPQFPQGLDTVLGESGAGLSEGQAQRLAIARAILGNAPILLLDECTSALDEETEKRVLSRIRELPDRTCIAVTHRQAAVALCDIQLKVTGEKQCEICRKEK